MRAVIGVAVVVAALAAPDVARAQQKESVRTKRPAMAATGVGTMALGAAGVATGIGFVVLWARETTTVAADCPFCGARMIPRDDAYLVGGILTIVSGALAILGGIPLVYFGEKHEHGPVAWLAPNGIAGRF